MRQFNASRRSMNRNIKCLFLSLIFWPLLPRHCRRRVLLLLLITLSDTHSVGLLSTSDWPIAETSTWQHNTHKRQTSLPQEGFEPTIPVIYQPRIYAWDCSATGTTKTCLAFPQYKSNELLVLSVMQTITCYLTFPQDKSQQYGFSQFHSAIHDKVTRLTVECAGGAGCSPWAHVLDLPSAA